MFGDDSRSCSLCLRKLGSFVQSQSVSGTSFGCVPDSMHSLIISLGAIEGNKGSIQINFICPGMSKIVLTQLIITVSS